MDERQDQPTIGVAPKTLTGKLNLFLGDKSHGWYFFYGIGLTVAAAWAIYVWIVVPINNRAFNNIYEDKQNTINKMQQDFLRQNEDLSNTIANIQQVNSQLDKEITALNDTLQLLRSFGLYLGTFPLVKKDIEIPLDGKKIQGSFNYEEKRYITLDLRIDTCKAGRYETECSYFYESVPIAFGGFASLSVGKTNYTFHCLKRTDSSVMLEVFRSNNQ